MRARNIKPSITKNEDLAELPFEARLLFCWLPMMADCEGKLEDRPKRIKAEMFPYDETDVHQLLSELHRKSFILRYAVEDLGNFIWIVNFCKHQNPHKQERAKGSEIPSYDPNIHYINDNGFTSVPLPNILGTKRADSLNLIPDSLIPDPLISESSAVVEDPNFQKPKYSPADVDEICKLATTVYKSTQYPSQVIPMAHCLLAQLPKETIVRAIKNVSAMFDESGRAHDKRPNFNNQFTNVQTVSEMAERQQEVVQINPQVATESKRERAERLFLEGDN